MGAFSRDYEAVYDYAAAEPDELPLRKGDAVLVEDLGADEGWWTGTANGRRGTFPASYVRPRPRKKARATDLDAVRPQKTPVADEEAATAEEEEEEGALTLARIRALDAKASAAEAALRDERAAAAAFRHAALSSLALLESSLNKALTPLGGIILEAPRTLKPGAAAVKDDHLGKKKRRTGPEAATAAAARKGGRQSREEEVDVWSGGAWAEPATRGDRLALALAAALRPKVETRLATRRSVRWDDLCAALAQCYDDEFDEQAGAGVDRVHQRGAARKIQLAVRSWKGFRRFQDRMPTMAHAATQTMAAAAATLPTNHPLALASFSSSSSSSTLKMTTTTTATARRRRQPPPSSVLLLKAEPSFDDDGDGDCDNYRPDAVAAKARQSTTKRKKDKHPETRASTRDDVSPERHHQQPAEEEEEDDVEAEDEDDEGRLAGVLERHTRALRALYKRYARRVGGSQHKVAVAAADFLRLCKDTGICSALLSRQEATAICRLSLARAAQTSAGVGVRFAQGLTEPQLSRALARCAAAAYSHMDHMPVSEKVDALFTHMGLSENPPVSFADNENQPKKQHSSHQGAAAAAAAAEKTPQHHHHHHNHHRGDADSSYATPSPTLRQPPVVARKKPEDHEYQHPPARVTGGGGGDHSGNNWTSHAVETDSATMWKSKPPALSPAGAAPPQSMLAYSTFPPANQFYAPHHPYDGGGGSQTMHANHPHAASFPHLHRYGTHHIPPPMLDPLTMMPLSFARTLQGPPAGYPSYANHHPSNAAPPAFSTHRPGLPYGAALPLNAPPRPFGRQPLGGPPQR